MTKVQKASSGNSDSALASHPGTERVSSMRSIPSIPQPDPRVEFITKAQAAQIFAVSPTTYMRLVKAGVIPPPVQLSTFTKRWIKSEVISAALRRGRDNTQ